MNDYEKTVEDCEHAIAVTETAYYNAQDADTQAKLQEAIEAIKAAKDLAEAHA